MKRYSLLASTIALGALLVACTGGSGVLGTVPPAPTSSAPAVDQGSPDIPAASPSASPSAGASVEPSPTGTTIVRAYFLLGGPVGTAGPVPVLREIPATKATATVAMNVLLAGPNDAEQKASISTTIPAGTQLLDLTIKGGVATVDLSREFESGGGSASVLGRLAQVVFTLTQFPTVKSVVFEVEGQPVTTFSGQGVVLDGPVKRADYDDLLPAIFVDRPAYGAALGNPGRVTGNANVFEATFRMQILDSGDHVIADEQVMATCGTGCRGTFDVTLHYTVPKGQYGTLRVLDLSAKDGSPENVRDYPVWLTPAG